MLNFIPLSIFGVSGVIYPFTLLMGVGFAHMFLGFTWSAKKHDIISSEVEKVQLILISSIVIGFIFAALSSQFLIKDVNTSITTITVMPGFLAGILVLVFIMKLYNLSIVNWLNFLIPYWCFAHGWGRIGCFLGGCCYGKPTDSFIGVSFPPGSIPFHVHESQSLHPTQIYEALILFLIGALLLKSNSHKYRIFLFFILYGTARFFIEFFRDDLRGNITDLSYLSPSQFFSFIFIIIGFLYLFMLRLYKNKVPN